MQFCVMTIHLYLGRGNLVKGSLYNFFETVKDDRAKFDELYDDLKPYFKGPKKLMREKYIHFKV